MVHLQVAGPEAAVSCQAFLAWQDQVQQPVFWSSVTCVLAKIDVQQTEDVLVPYKNSREQNLSLEVHLQSIAK